MATPVRISVFMITFNNTRTVARALASAAWADEIVVVDSFSTDDTMALARAANAKVLQHAWPGFRDQYQFAAEACSHDWVYYLDADEEIPPALAAEIRDAANRNQERPEAERAAGFIGHRRTWHLGRWIMHGAWTPRSDCEIRLYDRRRGRWLGDLHATVRVQGPTAHFRQLLNHYSYADLSDQLRKLDLYSTTAAADNLRNGKRFSLAGMFFEPPARFVRDYLLKRGFLDGVPGLVIAGFNAFQVFLRSAKQRELERAQRGD